MKIKQIKSKNFQGEFPLAPHNDEVFASAMDCSEILIKNLRSLTSKISLLQSRDFVANIDCRYCGRHFEKDIWVGLYFNNILFTSEKQLTIAIKDPDGCISQKLSQYTINFKSHFFASEDRMGRWVFVKLDNYLLLCDKKAALNEIERILSEILEIIK